MRGARGAHESICTTVLETADERPSSSYAGIGARVKQVHESVKLTDLISMIPKSESAVPRGPTVMVSMQERAGIGASNRAQTSKYRDRGMPPRIR